MFWDSINNTLFYSPKESFPGYDPQSYTAQETQALPTGADTDIME